MYYICIRYIYYIYTHTYTSSMTFSGYSDSQKWKMFQAYFLIFLKNEKIFSSDFFLTENYFISPSG